MGANQHIANAARIARIYGVSAIAMLVDNQEPNESLDYRTLYKHNVSFNILDPLNTAGSIVLNQDPNAQDFQKVDGIRLLASRITNRAVSSCRTRIRFTWRTTRRRSASPGAACTSARSTR
jgi:hypothetical protein